MTAEGSRTLSRLEDGHRQSNCDCRSKEKKGQRGRVPEGVDLARHDQIQRSERTLMQRGEQDSQNDQYWVGLLNPPDWSVQIKTLKHARKKFEEEDGGVGHHTHPDLKHDRVRVHINELMPYVPGPPEGEQQSNDEQQIAKERCQH